MTEYWTAEIIGIMMIISPWVLGFSDISLAKWCNVLLGLSLMVGAAWKLFGVMPAGAFSAEAEGDPPRKNTKKLTSNQNKK